MLPVAVNGCSGKMSTALAAMLSADPEFDFLGALTCRPQARVSDSAFAQGIVGWADLRGKHPTILDFSHHACTRKLLTRAHTLPGKLIIGTSGLTPADEELLCELSRTMAVFRAVNFSRGVHMLLKLLALAGKDLGRTWEARVLDVHFSGKLDTPSATASKMSDTLTDHGFAGCDISAIRLGDGVSEHTALLAGPGERLEVAHKLLDRKAFFATVKDAVHFLQTKETGLFGMDDLYG